MWERSLHKNMIASSALLS